MQILIDAAPGGGYTLTFVSSTGARKQFEDTLPGIKEMLDNAYQLTHTVVTITGIKTEPLISAAAIRENRNRDIAARKLWNDPSFRV